MHPLRAIAPVLAAVVLVAACGASSGASIGAAAPTQGAGGPAATPTDAAGSVPTDDSAAGTDTPIQGGGDTSKGTAHFDLTGVKTASGDLGFLAETSVFEVNGNKSAILYFEGSDTSTALVLTLAPDLTNVVLAAGGISASVLPINGTIGTCTATTSELDDHAAKGSFTCEHLAIGSDGALVGEGSISGTFDAHK